MEAGEKSSYWLHRESKPVFSKKPAHWAVTLLNITTTTTTNNNNNNNNTTIIAG